MNVRERAKEIRVLWEEMGYHPWKDNAFIVLDALEEAEEEVTTLKAQLEAAQGTIAAAQQQVAIEGFADLDGIAWIEHDPLQRILSRADTSVHDSVVLKEQARALRRAAAAIPEKMRMDELGLHQLDYALQLPEASRVMLNGATRFAERLVERAALMEQKASK